MSESDPPSQPDEILMDLLIKQVTEGLSPAEQRALDVLDSPVASAHAGDFERAAAAIALAGSAGAESLPPLLRARLEEQAHAFFAPGGAGAASASGSAAAARGAGPVDKVVELRAPTPSTGADRPAALPARAARSGNAGWWAAAACLVLALVGWLRRAVPHRGSRGEHAAASRAAGAGAGPCASPDARRGARRAARPARIAQDRLGCNQGSGSRGYVR